ncbi:unnamed protein product [Brassicogethes aeneus]|uniref:SAP domain-containing protein n=1 Tax=Brassicogethes aeneus TaxID=1431903 RepID=A0A9P0B7L4_BRAAE|nr:unnamed protein product [Brassicogethes aeneus]
MADDTLTELSALEISKLKVPDLKRELKLRGLTTSGNKNELVERLQAAMKTSDCVGVDSVDDLDEDLLNDDDDEHLEGDVVVEEEESVLNESVASKTVKRKISDAESDKTDKSGPPKKVILNRNTSVNIEPPRVLTEDKKESESEDDKKVIKLSEMTAKERLELRAKKFGGAPPDDLKKAVRAERFGKALNGSNSVNSIKTPVNTSIDVLKQRAERFGGSVSTVMSKVENQEKMEKRKARFGIVSNTNGATGDSDKAKARLERFKQPIK